uniref:DB domain-containing protein n=1 Tax=Caenorhabditis tropicalis TaxID=1561998 RepID=A0A1I7UN42_9PELO
MNRFTSILLIFGYFGVVIATFTNEQIKEASKKCCTPNRQECCFDLLKFGTPIRCGYENHKKFPSVVHDCLQKQLFATEPEKRIPLNGECSRIHFNTDLCPFDIRTIIVRILLFFYP